MVTDQQAEAAGQWIYDNCDAIADAKGERVKAEEFLRVVKSEIMLRTDGAQGHKEATALASQEYKDAIEGYSKAVRNESFLMTKMKAAENKIEIWRSQSANMRGLK